MKNDWQNDKRMIIIRENCSLFTWSFDLYQRKKLVMRKKSQLKFAMFNNPNKLLQIKSVLSNNFF